jgi:hypothetical protein
MDDGTLSYSEVSTEIEHYQYETFNSGEPYELLLSIDDELTRQRVKTAMRDKAKKCGFSVKDFDDSCKAALAKQKRQAKEFAEAQRRKKKDDALNDAKGTEHFLDGLMKKLNGNRPNFGKYICNDSSIMYMDPFGVPVKICSHPIFPTMRYVNIETGSELMDISFMLDGRWRHLRLIDRKALSQSRTVVTLSEYGLDVTSENAKEIVNYLASVDQLNRDIIPRRETVKHLGWVRDRGFSPYIDGVDYDSGGKFEEAFRAVRSNGDFEKWKDVAAQVMVGGDYMPARIMLAASVASVVLKWTSQQPFIVHLWSSQSSTGKTIALMLAASVWADPELGRYVRSMNATKVANEQLAGFCNNLPLILDELQTIQKNTDFDDIIYMLCEGTGKARGSRDGGLREQTRWMNTILTSGEQPISAEARAGAVNRVISIETEGQIIPGDKSHMSDFADTLRENFGHAGRMIIERIIGKEDFGDSIRAAYKDAMSNLAQHVTGKQANYGASVLVGDALLNGIVFDGAFPPLLPSDILPYLATQDMVDTNKKALDWLLSFVAINGGKFHVEGEEILAPVKSEIMGKIDNDGNVYIIKGVLKDKLDQRGWVLVSFLQWCDQRGYLKTNHTKTNRHWEIYTHIDGVETSTVPVIVFKKELFNGQEVKS